MKRNSQQGVALVITLIMLTVITVITMAFLAIASRESASVATSSSKLTSVQLADAGLERAKAMVRAYIIASSNRVAPDLLVSVTRSGPTNNIDYPGMADSWQDGDPRAPVFVKTNSSGDLDFRLWLDLDRNGRFTPTGLMPVFDQGGVSVDTNYQVGDPQWIGVLRDPSRPHGRGNPFIGRYAYIVLPVGKSLDLNFIHNNAKGIADPFRRTERPGFFRNQGVGSWELNLAAFLADLNTNEWRSYLYSLDPAAPSGGVSFDDATSLLSWRYGGSFRRLPSADFGFAHKIIKAFNFSISR